MDEAGSSPEAAAAAAAMPVTSLASRATTLKRRVPSTNGASADALPITAKCADDSDRHDAIRGADTDRPGGSGRGEGILTSSSPSSVTPSSSSSSAAAAVAPPGLLESLGPDSAGHLKHIPFPSSAAVGVAAAAAAAAAAPARAEMASDARDENGSSPPSEEANAVGSGRAGEGVEDVTTPSGDGSLASRDEVEEAGLDILDFENLLDQLKTSEYRSGEFIFR